HHTDQIRIDEDRHSGAVGKLYKPHCKPLRSKNSKLLVPPLGEHLGEFRDVSSVTQACEPEETNVTAVTFGCDLQLLCHDDSRPNRDAVGSVRAFTSRDPVPWQGTH